MLPGRGFGYLFPEIIIQGVGDKPCRFPGSEGAEVFQHFFAHGNKGIAAFNKVTDKCPVARPFFMRDNIIQDSDNPGVLILSDLPENGTESRSHEWQPEFYYYNVRLQLANLLTRSPPVKWVDGIDPYFDIQLIRRRFRGKL